MTGEAVDWERNQFVVRGEWETMFPNLLSNYKFTHHDTPIGHDQPAETPDGLKVHSIVLDLHLFPWEDDTFRGYHFTPFPKLYATERKMRHLATEGRERVTGAWKVLRGDRDPFNVGDEW
jgi:hypothetical protein